MAQPKLGDIERLLYEIIVPFYEIERDMPIPVPSYRNENDAEHSWSLALLTSILAPEIDSSLDIGKATIFAIVHDVVEVYAGDTSFWGKAEHKATKAAREEKAAGTIRDTFPAFPALARYISDYERKDSSEALFVYALDKFLNMLIRTTDKGKYFRQNKIGLQKFRTTIVEHKKKAASHPGVSKYYQELLDHFLAHPEYFYKGEKHG